MLHVQGIPLNLVAITIHCIRYKTKNGGIGAILVSHKGH